MVDWTVVFMWGQPGWRGGLEDVFFFFLFFSSVCGSLCDGALAFCFVELFCGVSFFAVRGFFFSAGKLFCGVSFRVSWRTESCLFLSDVLSWLFSPEDVVSARPSVIFIDAQTVFAPLFCGGGDLNLLSRVLLGGGEGRAITEQRSASFRVHGARGHKISTEGDWSVFFITVYGAQQLTLFIDGVCALFNSSIV